MPTTRIVPPILIALIGTLVLSDGLRAQNRRTDRPPQLLVEIVMGSVTPDVIERHWERMNPRGIPKLFNRGVVVADARYPGLICNSVSGLGTLSTGANPSRHGVVARTWFSHVTFQPERFDTDPKCDAVGVTSTDYHVSPRKLPVGTLAESWRLAFPKSQIYSLALDPSEALILAGRSANAALWMHRQRGLFVSSSFYTTSLPRAIEQLNASGQLPRLLAKPWFRGEGIPGYEPDGRAKGQVPGPMHERKVLGAHFNRLKYTPMGNTLLKELLVQLIEQDSVGRGPQPDMVALYLSAFEGIAALYGPESRHMQDAILRFDSQIANLLEYLDASLGPKNYLIVLTSAYGADATPIFLERQRVPNGVFNPDRAVLMLNAYLKALYSEPDLVLGYSDLQFYLNGTRIDQLKIPRAKILEESAEFLAQLSGVAAVYPASILQWASSGNDRIRRASEGFYAKRSGDLIVDLMPGHIVSASFSSSAVNSPISHNPRVPLVMYGWKLPHRMVTGQTSMRDVVATLCALFHLPTPNANEGSPLAGVVDWDQ